VERHGDLEAELARFASFADMVVLSSPRDVPFPDMHRAIGDFLVRAKKPVLTVPGSATGIAVNGEALLLWDGSDQASAAMRAAMPLFRRAASVIILEIDDGSLEIPATVAAAHLSQHGIISSARRDGAFGEKTGSVIIEQIGLIGPAYVVMGGFGRSRLVESLFGGVTERLLKDTPVPLFLKH
jgi:nucleotide-binding universal stress UspA family protein